MKGRRQRREKEEKKDRRLRRKGIGSPGEEVKREFLR